VTTERPGSSVRLEGFAASLSNEDDTMDLKGAQELARRLEERHGAAPEPAPPAPLANAAAAPIFRWLGIEPPAEPAAFREPVAE
jgi:hypothetical protein